MFFLLFYVLTEYSKFKLNICTKIPTKRQKHDSIRLLSFVHAYACACTLIDDTYACSYICMFIRVYRASIAK